MTQRYFGSCLCNKITFCVTGFSQNAANCYCSMCRKFHGAAFGTLVAVSELQWLSGLELLKDYRANNGTIRSFCSECGSSLGFRTRNSSLNDIEIAISTFDQDIPVAIDAQIYTAFKPNWCQLQSNILTFEEGRY